ncbi:hypothetical protein [Paraburkholderia sp. C35]|uniref:hypothetical protein n=1 Tax=Paraburkholderia sp. C35 TaxID=2126993 RepID=UPI000D694B33|nr:hypothetical protein [Paraburkholderia sp. C35]
MSNARHLITAMKFLMQVQDAVYREADKAPKKNGILIDSTPELDKLHTLLNGVDDFIVSEIVRNKERSDAEKAAKAE